MSGGHETTIRECIPQAEIAFDPFHVMWFAQSAVELRRNEWNADEPTHRKSEQLELEARPVGQARSHDPPTTATASSRVPAIETDVPPLRPGGMHAEVDRSEAHHTAPASMPDKAAAPVHQTSGEPGPQRYHATSPQLRGPPRRHPVEPG